MRARGAASAQHGQHVAWGLLVQLTVVGESDAALRELMAFYREVDLPLSLTDLGMAEPSDAEIDDIATLTMTAPHVLNLPVAVDAETIATAIRRVERFR
jgi:glycerol dehydrogenase